MNRIHMANSGGSCEDNRKAVFLSFGIRGLDKVSGIIEPSVIEIFLGSLHRELKLCLEGFGGVPQSFRESRIAAAFHPEHSAGRHGVQSVECAMEMVEILKSHAGGLCETGMDIFCGAGLCWGPVGDTTRKAAESLEESAGRNGLLVSREITEMTCDAWSWEPAQKPGFRPDFRKEPVACQVFNPESTDCRQLLEAWREFLSQGADSSGGVAIIGNAGLGKTVLARQFASAISEGEEHVVECSGFSRAGRPPLAMWFIIGGDRAKPGGEHLPPWLASALREIAGSRKRVIVLVRDVHCADEASIGVLSRLLVLPPEGVSLFFILVGEYLPEQIPANRLRVLHPSPMTAMEIGDFIESSLQGDKEPDLVKSLVALLAKTTMGYPVFVHQTLLHMVSGGYLKKGAGDRWKLVSSPVGIPPTVEAILQGRMDRLSGELRSGLRVSGLLGRSFRRDLFAHVYGTFTGADPEPVLEGLVGTGFLSCHGDMCHFTGSLLAEAAESLLTSDDSRRIHRIAAEFLAEGRTPSESEPWALETANHYAGAGLHREGLPWGLAALAQMAAVRDCSGGLQLLGELRKWPHEIMDQEASYRMDMADYVLNAARGSAGEALELFEKLRPRAPVSDLQKIMLIKASILAARGETMEAVHILEQALNLRSEPEEKKARATILCRLCNLLATLGNIEQSMEYQEAALNLAENDPDTMECILGNLAMTRLLAGNTRKAEELCRMALATNRYGGNLKHKADLLGALSIIAFRTGRDRQGIEFSQAAVEIHRRSGNTQGLCSVLGNTGSMLARAGKLEPAMNALSEALSMARQMGWAKLVTVFSQSIGNILVIEERYEEAETYIMEALSVAENMGSTRSIAAALTSMGCMKLNSGLLDQAEVFIARAIRMQKRAGNISGQANCLSSMSEINLARGNFDQALHFSEEAHKMAAAAGDFQSSTSIRFLRGKVLLAAGRVGEAAKEYETAMEAVQKDGMTVGGFVNRDILERGLRERGVQIGSSAER